MDFLKLDRVFLFLSVLPFSFILHSLNLDQIEDYYNNKSSDNTWKTKSSC